MTPVRMALSRLAGERLIEVHANDGYHALSTSEKDLKDLYAVKGYLMDRSIECTATAEQRDIGQMPDLDWTQAVAATEGLFSAMAAAAGNDELAANIQNLNDRLHLVRILEQTLRPDWREELEYLANRWNRADYSGLREALIKYHQSRIDDAAEVMKILYVPRPRSHRSF